jgi:hypothetical protein
MWFGCSIASLQKRGRHWGKEWITAGSGLRRRGGGRHATEGIVAPAQEDTGAGAAAVGKEGTDAWRGVA